MTFEETLKAKGFTDADFADPTMAPILAKFRPAYEEAIADNARLAGEFSSYKSDFETRYQPEVTTRIAELEQKEVAARRRAADLEEQVRIAKEYGLITDSTNPNPQASAPARPQLDQQNMQFDPKAYKLVTHDDVASFARQEAQAIAMAYDLGATYRNLTGKDLVEYQGADGSYGMESLLKEAQANRAPSLKQYAEQKFRFNDLRQQKAAEAQKAREDAIRKEAAEATRAEMAQQYGNPNLRTPAPSRVPFIAKNDNGSAPWEKTADQKRAERIQRATSSVMTQRVQ